MQSVHNDLAEVLDTLAVLSGFLEGTQGRLPDGTKPDVLRVSLPSGAVFIGDAKDTESPGCTATRQRLANYLRWFKRNADARHVGGVLAICCSHGEHVPGWKSGLVTLASDAGMPDGSVMVRHDRIDDGAWVVTLRYRA